MSSPSNGEVVIGCWIEHRVSKQTIDNVDVAVLSGTKQSVVLISVALQLARCEHLLHKLQSTIGSVITECFDGRHGWQLATTVAQRD
mgnify:CR=1 FL=1